MHQIGRLHSYFIAQQYMNECMKLASEIIKRTILKFQITSQITQVNTLGMIVLNSMYLLWGYQYSNSM